LLLLVSSASGQYGGYYAPPYNEPGRYSGYYPPAYNMARMGNSTYITPGYGTPAPYSRTEAALASEGAAPSGYYSPGYQAYYPPAGTIMPRTGAALQGLASLTSASGQYWNQIEQARILRQQSYQANIQTAKQQVEFEKWYEQNRPTALTMAASAKASALNWARNDAEDTQIWAGRPLNVLLQSILRAPNPTGGPKIDIDQNTVRGLNLVLPSSFGNLALAKNGGKIAWTETLEGSAFDVAREGFSQEFAMGIKTALTGNTPSVELIEGLQTALGSLSTTLDDEVQDITPTAYIESRRLLNQLKNTIVGLKNPVLCQTCSDTWKKQIHTVADIVKYCMDNGMHFGPAVAAGDYPAYIAFYYAIRSYERDIWETQAQ
jgi:hypothetical protein